MTTKQAQRVYLKAARMIAEREQQFSCVAISFAPGRNQMRLRDLYVRIMLNDSETPLEDILPRASFSTLSSLRILLLCMMATVYPDLKKQGMFDGI